MNPNTTTPTAEAAHERLPPLDPRRRNRQRSILFVGLAILLCGAGAWFAMFRDPTSVNDRTFEKITPGMTRSQVEEIFNSRGDYDKNAKHLFIDAETGQPLTYYSFTEDSLKRAAIAFRKDTVVLKYAFKRER